MLEVDIALPLGGFALDARFATGRGITALFGRSGSGKTTVINCVAGLLRPRRGRIVADGRVLFDAEAGVDVPRHRRRVGYVFQDARLFPHLSVRQNLLYGRRFARAGRRTALSRRRRWRRSSTCWASATCSTAGRARCPAASASASRSAGRCWRTRACC
jgi:molybdate transport system ATP-binding protein